MNEPNIMKILYRMKYGLLPALLVLLAAISASGQIQLTFNSTEPTCNGFTNGTATVTATGGAEPYAYLWSNNQTGQTTFGIGAGVFSVTVTDQNGLTATGSVTVTQPDPLTVDFEATGFSCTSDEGTLTANPAGGTAPFAYSWNTNEITQTIVVYQAGTYIVTVTDANGCSQVEAYNVAPVAEFFPVYTYHQPLCAGQPTGSIDVLVYGTNPGFSYVWENGVANQSLINVPAGNYGITITDATGCTFTDTAMLLDQAQLLVDVIATDIPCSYLPDGGAVSAIVAGGNLPYTYVWSNGSNQSGQQGLPAGIYSVTVYDKFGCTASASDTINIPDPLGGIIVSISPACGGNNGCITVQGTGGTPPYTYMWPVLGITGPTVCGLGPGDYYVCIFDANHCQHDVIITLDSIGSLDVNLNLTDATCPGIDNGTVVATVDPPTGVYNYQWQPQPQPNSPQIDSLAAGTIVSVTVTDINTGCLGTATDTIGAETEVHLAVTHTDVTCPPDQTGSAAAVATGGTTPYDYVWTFPDSSTATGPNITGLGTGIYTVSVTDEKGCTAIETAEIEALSNPVADYELMVLECEADGITVQFLDQSKDSSGTIVSWNWSIFWSNGTATSTQQNPPSLQFPMDETGTVHLTVTSAQGCTAVIDSTFQITGAPTADVSVPAVDCENDPVTITVTNGAPNNTYTWLNTAGLTFDPDATNVIANPTETTVYQLVIANGLCTDTVEREVVRVLPINLTVQDPSIVTCDTAATLTAQANAAANVTYVWLDSNGDTVGVTATVNVQAQGVDVYTVIATDPYGCSESANATVTGNSVDVKTSFDADTLACDNVPLVFAVTNLDPTDDLTFQWSASNPNVVIAPPGAATVTATSPTGNYTISVIVTNQHGCTQTFSSNVNVAPTTSLEGAITIDLCNGLVVGFQNDITVSGVWTFGDNMMSNESSPTHTYAQPGSYHVTFTSPEICVLPYDTTIMVLPDAAVQAAILSNYVSCADTALLQFSDNSTHFYPISNWNWSFSSGQTSAEENPVVTFTEEGMVIAYLTVTDAIGCKDTTSLPVQISVVKDSLNSEEPFCPGEAVALNPDFNPAYTYQWVSDPNDPNFDPDSPNPSVMPLVQTVYTATIANGPCIVKDSITVTPEEAATVELPEDQLVCSDDPITIKAGNTNGVTFVWSESPDFTPPLPSVGDSVVITPKKNGIYYVKAENAAGCTVVDSVKINNAAVEIDAEPANRSICKGDSTELTVTNLDPEDVLTYVWAPALDSIPNPVVAPETTSVYSVLATNQFGCADTMLFNVNVISIEVTAEVMGKDTVCPGQSTELLATVTTNGANISYSWTPSNSLTGEDTANPTASPSETTVYTVTALADDLCPDTASVIVYFMSGECAEPYIFVPKAFTPNSDGNNDFFIVRGLDIKEVYFVVWDRWGEKVYETSDPQAQGWDGTFKGKELTPDSYAWYLEVTCGNGEVYTDKGDVTLLK
ncbi:MAG: PKD domain-containing protein [Haliscomenobacteraceae bacterium CHB4]|nr:PKD domain-containing protein [Haliscomenobacteraceae bacterium CHB4]